MDIDRLLALKEVRELFPADEKGNLPEGSCLLLSAMEELDFPPGRDIVTWGQAGEDGMYILMEGSAQVLDCHGEEINTLMGPGSIVGEMALIRDEPRGATVRAITRVRAARLSRVQFEEAAGSNRRLYGELLNVVYKKTTSLVREQARLHSELDIAARIQTGLLRRDFGGLEEQLGLRAWALMEPAKEVGGDFYDIFPAAPGKACIVIADVSGKGVPAALFMTMAKTHIKNYAMLDMPLEELAFRVNNRLCEDNPEEMFVTAFIGMLDTEQGILTFVNAGHNHPYVSSEQGPFRQAACHSDFVLGLWEDMKYREQKLELGKQGTIFLYTDGVTEAENPEEEMFGEQRLKAVLDCCAPEEDPKGIISRISMAVKDFSVEKGAVQTDDITMLCVRALCRKEGNER